MKKIISSILLLIFAGSCLYSCKNPESVVIDALEEISDTVYQMDIDLEFNSPDPALSKELESYKVRVPVIIDGDNIFCEFNVDFFENPISISNTVIDKVLYCSLGELTKFKCVLTDTELESFKSRHNITVPVKLSDFHNVTMLSEDKGKTVINCTGASSDAVERISSVFETVPTLELINVDPDSIAFSVIVVDGKFSEILLSASMNAKKDSKPCQVDLSLTVGFDYDVTKKVTAPDNTEDYTLMPYDEFFGK